MYNWRYHYALKQRFEKENPELPKTSGIYLWKREEAGITYFYVGQAQNLYNRRFDYYKIEKGLAYPTRHFEASLKKHKDWTFALIELCDTDRLDEREKFWINYYLKLPNYVTRNDLLAGNDIVRSNYRRITQIKNKQFKAIQQCFKYLTTQMDANGLKIGLKRTKKGVPTALSTKYFNKLVEMLGIKEKTNE